MLICQQRWQVATILLLLSHVGDHSLSYLVLILNARVWVPASCDLSLQLPGPGWGYLANIGVGKQAEAAAQGRETPLWSRATGGNCREYNIGQEIPSVL